MIPMLLFSLHLAGFQIWHPAWTLFFEGHFCFLILTLFISGELYFKYANPALFCSIALTKYFMTPSLFAMEVNRLFRGWLFAYLVHFSVLESAILVQAIICGCNTIFCLHSLTHIESNKTSCSQVASQTTEQWLLISHKCSNYITESFPQVF